MTTNQNIRHVTIMGLGLFGGGVGAAEYWAKKGAAVTVTDLRDRETLAPSISALSRYSNITYVLGEHREQDFTDTDLLLVNPAVKPDNHFLRLAREHGVPVTTEIGIFIHEHQQVSGNPIIAVTGSNGKSTTTALLSHILSTINSNTLSGGNIGGSLLKLLGTYPQGTPAVLELSSFQLHYLADDGFAPEIGVITNLAPNHLDWHLTVDNYYNDKQQLISKQSNSAFAILNYADPILKEWNAATSATTIFTSLKPPEKDNHAGIENDIFTICCQGRKLPLAKLTELNLPGTHNQENALQALSAAFIYITNFLQVKDKGVLKGRIKNFTGLPHRQEIIAEEPGTIYVNDSIATTPESTIAALRSYPERRIIIIAGGYDKKIPLESMSREIAEKAAAAILIGQTSEIIANQIRKYKPDFDIVVTGSQPFSEAISEAKKRACGNSEIILLSPGCASYGMFDNFQHRGNEFKAIVTATIDTKREK